MKPILYLDVDDTLIGYVDTPEFFRRHDAGLLGLAPHDVRRVLEEAASLCEVRWLTWWCPAGIMGDKQRARLARCLDVPVALLEPFYNPLQFWGHKTDGIDWEAHRAGREWFWIEDWCSEEERARLRGNHCEDRFYMAHAGRDLHALARAWDAIKQRIAAATPAGRPSEPGREGE